MANAGFKAIRYLCVWNSFVVFQTSKPIFAAFCMRNLEKSLYQDLNNPIPPTVDNIITPIRKYICDLYTYIYTN